MAIIILPDNGQQFELPDVIARDDAKLRAALAIPMPTVASAEIERTEKDGVLTVRVIKKALTKGASDWLQVLKEAPEEINPAFLMYQKVKEMEANGSELTIEQITAMESELKEAFEDGHLQGRQISKVLNALKDAPVTAAGFVPGGF